MNKQLAALACGVLFACAASAETIKGRVVGVADGDTIRIIDGAGRVEKIRLNGIDAPEKRQAFGARAKQFTANAVMRKDVTLVTHGRDRYGRIIADVYQRDGKCLNEALVRDGFAWWYQKYSRDQRLRALEETARKRRVGLWHDTKPEAPWEFRRAEREAR